MARWPYYGVALVCRHRDMTVDLFVCYGLREGPVGITLPLPIVSAEADATLP